MAKTDDKDVQKKKGKSGVIIVFLILILLLIWLAYPFFNNSSTSKQALLIDTMQSKNKDSINIQKQKEFLKAAISDDDTNYQIIRVSSKEALELNYAVDNKAGKEVKRIFTGRRINIAVTGVDARVGTSTKHADANHILSILIDSGQIEIISIPRDTHADAGLGDSNNQNKLTIVRALRGRDAYLEEAAKIAGLDKIHYYVEASFSQVMGMLELLGFKDPASALQVLRSRTALGGDDFQRVYNQAQFIRQTLLKHNDKLTGVLGEIIIRGGLALVETNLTASIVKDIVGKLRAKGFPKSASDITIKVRPPLPRSFKVYDFTDQKVFNSLSKKIEDYNSSQLENDSTIEFAGRPKINGKLWAVIKKAIQDSAKYPDRVIAGLKVYFEQRAWLQVTSQDERSKIRDQFGILLSSAYIRKKRAADAARVRETIDAEKNIFSKPIFYQGKR